MSQQIITNLEGGLPVRTALNNMFTDLYGALAFPFKLVGIAGNAEQQILSGTFIPWIFILPVAGAPIIQLGITGGGEEILAQQPVTDFVPIGANQWFAETGTIYVTLSGGTVSVCIIPILNVF